MGSSWYDYTPIGAAAGLASGTSPLAKGLGLSGEQGEYYQPSELQSTVNQGLDRMNSNLLQLDPHQAEKDQEATGSQTGSMFATNQVQNNPILGQLFGQGGSLSRGIGKEQELQDQGFKLTGDDHEAYGQASGNIARLFGQSENNLAQSLANRGLSQGPSGAAGAAFSGLSGNKNEQLAGAQMKIANDRMQNTMQRIGQQQKFIQDLGQQGNKAIGDQYGRQLAGAENYQNQVKDTAAANNAHAQTDTQRWMAQQAAQQASMTDKRGAKGKTLAEGLGNGLFGSATAVGQIPGQMAGQAAGVKTSGITGDGSVPAGGMQPPKAR